MLTNKLKLAAIGAVGLLCTNLSYADRSGFYTIIGPDGRVMVIDRSTSDSKKAIPREQKSVKATLPSAHITSTPSVDTPPLARKPSIIEEVDRPQPIVSKVQPKLMAEKINQAASNHVTAQSPLVEASTAPKNQLQVQTEQVTTNPVTIIDGEQYIDSEYLEQREFNLEGKKRFYNLPNGIGGTEILEREKGVDMSVFKRTKVEQPQVVNLAKGYQRIDKDQVVELIGMQCFSQKQLKKPKLLRKDEPLNLWPRSGFEPKFDFIVAEFDQQINDIQLTSYTDNMTAPQFYWPLPIFLDSKGCIIEGVNTFYQQTIPATATTHQALQGYLHIPSDTKYLVLTPLEAAADLTQVQLTNKGQVRLTPIR